MLSQAFSKYVRLIDFANINDISITIQDLIQANLSIKNRFIEFSDVTYVASCHQT